MQISVEDRGDLLELRVVGRLDNEWASHLTDFIDKAVRQGSHSIVLDLTDVSYLSSAGIGALVRAHKQFQSIRGFFGVGIAPPQVHEVIRMTGLAKMLLCDIEQVRRAAGGGLRSTMQPMFRVAAEAGMAFELYEIKSSAGMTCEVVGDPGRLPNQLFQEQDCRSVRFPSGTLGIGLGAFGQTFVDCRDRLGEFLAVDGAVAHQPASTTSRPDYQVEQGELIPQVQMAYGLRCRGGFQQHQRFEPVDQGIKISLSSLVDQCLTLNETDLGAIVIVAETSGLIGASLLQSPTVMADAGASKFSHPEIRRWLSFSPERSHPHSLALIAGVASRGRPAIAGAADLAPLLRPMSPKLDLYGHFHAAVFSYRPFKKRKLELSDIVGALFESEDLQAVMHLLHDDREITGGGESEFHRGACWVSSISNVQRGPLE